MRKLSIIVVNYRTPALTIAAIRSAQKYPPAEIPYEIILVDNGSPDDSVSVFDAEISDVQRINLQENVGFAGANNLASQIVNGDFILFLNPDTEVFEGSIQRLLDFAQSHPDAGAWGGRTVFEDMSLNPTSVCAFPSLWSMAMRAIGLSALLRNSGFFNPDTYPNWQRDTVRPVDTLFFCYVLMKTSVWRRLGGFDLRFFMFSEDEDLCWRMEQLGLQRLFTPDSVIIHHGGRSITQRADRQIALLRARLQWIDLHWRGPRRALARFLLDTMVVTRLWAETLHGRQTVWRQVWRARGHWRGTANATGGAVRGTP